MSTTHLRCPRCGADLALAEGRARATCDYCGAQSAFAMPAGSDGAATLHVVAGHPPSFFEAALAEADPTELRRLCAVYVEGAQAAAAGREPPDPATMHAVEDAIDVTDATRAAFRQEIANYAGALAIEGRKVEPETNARLHRALAAHLHLRRAPSSDDLP